jgi:hypothetical protein
MPADTLRERTRPLDIGLETSWSIAPGRSFGRKVYDRFDPVGPCVPLIYFRQLRWPCENVRIGQRLAASAEDDNMIPVRFEFRDEVVTDEPTRTGDENTQLLPSYD